MVLSKESLKRIKALVQNNDHGGAYLLAAQKLGLDDLAERFGSINRRHMQLGYLPTKLYVERYEAYQELNASAQDKLGAIGFKEFYDVF